MSMTSRQRVMTALRRQEPDRVPYFELSVDRALAAQVMGWSAASQAFDRESNQYTAAEAKEVSARLQMDNIRYVLRAPVYAKKEAGQDGRLFYGAGLIRSEADLDMLKLPDPHDDALYEEAAEFAANKGDYAACLVTRMGIFPTMLSLGIDGFSYALYENRSFLEKVLDLYCDWTVAVAERVCKLGFDLFATTDDLAFKSAPFFSPKVFRELVMPRYRRLREAVTLPWMVHSDGNLMPILEDILSLGIAGLHPIEKGAMDIRVMKRDYGGRLCLMGNVDLNLLGLATEEEVDQEVRELIRDIAPGGGYMVTSGNSLAGYLKGENVIAMARAVQKYGRYPIRL